MAAIAIIEESRRIYLYGNTYPIKEKLKARGAKWDADLRMWWIGASKRGVIESLLQYAATPTPAPDAPVLGKAIYKGRSSGNECMMCGSEALDKNLRCRECGYTSPR